ncbi:MAG TPA: hypothetical protein VG651_01650 [Stellaceae bacterium]|nr:hypothetical protein [Stellaceae bacterium]
MDALNRRPGIYEILMRRGSGAPSNLYALDLIFPGAASGRRMMLDVVYLAIGCGFLAAAVLYVAACDRL